VRPRACRYLSHKAARFEHEDGEAILDDMFAFWDQINTEDIEVVEKVQRGTATAAYQGGRFSFRFEEPVHRFQNMVSDKMVADPATQYRIPDGDADYPQLRASMQEPATEPATEPTACEAHA
jgi:choline monooxygenase